MMLVYVTTIQFQTLSGHQNADKVTVKSGWFDHLRWDKPASTWSRKFDVICPSKITPTVQCGVNNYTTASWCLMYVSVFEVP